MNTEQAAQAIVALINSSPRSPRQDEIEAIIAKIATHKAGNVFHGHSAHRADWDALVLEANAVNARSTEIQAAGGSHEAAEAAEAICCAAEDRIDACANRIFRTPARNPADILLLAEACFRTLWSGTELTAPEADARMANGPDHDIGASGICADALRALLKGIRDLALKSGEVRHD